MSNLNESSVYRTAMAGYIMPVGRPLVGGKPMVSHLCEGPIFQVDDFQ